MPVVVYKTEELHPDELTGFLVYETITCGIVNDNPTRSRKMPFERMDLYANSDRTIRVYVKTPDMDIVDLTGAQGILTLKTDKDTDEISLRKDTDIPEEGLIGSADQGEMFFYILHTDTDALDPRQYLFDIRVTLENDKTYTVLEGVINLKKSVG